jgi:cyclopropane fatty-acyl-phospholipid synthase-like methyltransferase
VQTPYDLIANEWHAQRARSFREKRFLDIILPQLAPEATVLDVGCGTGEPIARYVSQQGFRVVGVDCSAKMLEIARQVVPGARLTHADILEVDFSERFAAVIAWDSIFHIGSEHHQTVFRKIHGWLESAGWLLLSLRGSGEKGFTSEMFGHTFFYSGHEPREALRRLEMEGFQIISWEVDDPSSRGHVAVIARRRA